MNQTSAEWARWAGSEDDPDDEFSRKATREARCYCMHCDTTFSSEQALLDHKVEQPRDPSFPNELRSREIKTCPTRCETAMYWVVNRKRYLNPENAPFQISECYLGSAIPFNKQLHWGSFKCHFCNRRFDTTALFCKHLRNYTAINHGRDRIRTLLNLHHTPHVKYICEDLHDKKLEFYTAEATRAQIRDNELRQIPQHSARIQAQFEEASRLMAASTNRYRDSSVPLSPPTNFRNPVPSPHNATGPSFPYPPRPGATNPEAARAHRSFTTAAYSSNFRNTTPFMSSSTTPGFGDRRAGNRHAHFDLDPEYGSSDALGSGIPWGEQGNRHWSASDSIPRPRDNSRRPGPQNVQTTSHMYSDSHDEFVWDEEEIFSDICKALEKMCDELKGQRGANHTALRRLESQRTRLEILNEPVGRI